MQICEKLRAEVTEEKWLWGRVAQPVLVSETPGKVDIWGLGHVRMSCSAGRGRQAGWTSSGPRQGLTLPKCQGAAPQDTAVPWLCLGTFVHTREDVPAVAFHGLE